jgi:hypothetical protein
MTTQTAATGHRHGPRIAYLSTVLVGLVLLAGCTTTPPPAGPTAGRAAASPQAVQHDWTPISTALHKTGSAQPGGVYRVNFPRTDLSVTSDGVLVRPALSLGSYFTFSPLPTNPTAATGGQQVMAMGDLVLTEPETQPVLARLAQGGLTITAIHKHLRNETPRLWWVHVHGMGNQDQLAAALRSALDLTATPATAPTGSTSPLDLDTAALDTIMGRTGTADGGVYKYTLTRAEPITENSRTLPAAMGVTTSIGFQPTGAGKAAINGDIAMTASEVPAVLAALRQADIDVVSLHNHSLDETPRLFYLHFWANADAPALARGLRNALDRTHSAPPTR